MEYEDSTELEFEYNDLPVCPFCKKKWDWDGDLLRSNSEEIETYCPSCSKDIRIVPHYEVTYSTYRSKEAPHDAP